MNKVGHWDIVEIDKDIQLSGKGIVIQCDRCRFVHSILYGPLIYAYCPQCGQQMIVSVEDVKSIPDCTELKHH